MQKLLILLVSLLLVACSGDPGEKAQSDLPAIEEGKEITIPAEAITTDSGLKYVDLEEGDGNLPEKGQQVSVHYSGYLLSGKMFDSSHKRNQPLSFQAGIGQMIPGFDEGVMSLRQGGKRRLFIPGNLGYGPNGMPPVIPPDATLVFDIELVEIK